MSYHAQLWAFDQKPEKPLDKLVLIGLASHVNPKDGNVCFPTQEYLARFCGDCSLDSVQRAIRRLVAGGYIKVVERTDHYTLLIERA